MVQQGPDAMDQFQFDHAEGVAEKVERALVTAGYLCTMIRGERFGLAALPWSLNLQRVMTEEQAEEALAVAQQAVLGTGFSVDIAYALDSRNDRVVWVPDAPEYWCVVVTQDGAL